MKTISPKETFLASQAATRFAELVSDPVMALGIETAMLQFVMDQAAPDRLEVAAYRQHELQGAKQFVSILINLCAVGDRVPAATNVNLQWQRQQPTAPPQPKQPAPVTVPPQPLKRTHQPNVQPRQDEV